MNNTLHTYVRDRKNNPIGVVVVTKIDNKIYCGWSLAKRKAGDKFNKEIGLSMALGRAVNLVPAPIPQTVLPVWKNITQRARKYFKNCDFAC